jgi:hypothetical protein
MLSENTRYSIFTGCLKIKCYISFTVWQIAGTLLFTIYEVDQNGSYNLRK